MRQLIAILVGSALALLASGCRATQIYSGVRLPADQVAVLEAKSERYFLLWYQNRIKIRDVDGVRLKDFTPSNAAEVLPGKRVARVLFEREFPIGKWKSLQAGPVTIDTFGSGYNTTLGVYTGTVLTSLVLVADNNYTTGPQSRVTFVATVGMDYQIQVNGFSGSSGSIALRIIGTPGPPPNDNFVNRFTLNGATVVRVGTAIFGERPRPARPAPG